MVSRVLPAFSTLSLFAEVIVDPRIFKSSETESTQIRKKLGRKRMTLVVLGGGVFKKMMAGYIAAP